MLRLNIYAIRLSLLSMDYLIILINGGIISIIPTILLIYYKISYNKPKLYYSNDLQSYSMDDEIIFPIIIGNNGHAKATNVRLTIDFVEGNVLNVCEKIPDNFSKKIENENRFIYEFKRIASSTNFPIYFKVSKKGARYKTTIVSDEGPGSIKSPEIVLSREEFLFAIFYVIFIIIGIMLMNYLG